MAFDTAAVATALVTLVQGLSGMQGTVVLGVPESLPVRVSAYVTLGTQEVSDKVTAVLERRTVLRVTFGYRVAGAEATAEADLMAMADAFLAAYYAARRTDLGGTVVTLDPPDTSANAGAEYQAIAGQEFRRYVVDCPFRQRQGY